MEFFKQTGSVIVFRDTQGLLSWAEIKDDMEIPEIISAREGQVLRLMTITNQNEVKKIVRSLETQGGITFFLGR
jgi:hypothetical protein